MVGTGQQTLPSPTVTSQTTRASVLLGSSAFGTIDASVITTRLSIDDPNTGARPMTSCSTVSSVCLTSAGRLPIMWLMPPAEEASSFLSESMGRVIVAVVVVVVVLVMVGGWRAGGLRQRTS